jgi:hypothetical protein
VEPYNIAKKKFAYRVREYKITLQVQRGADVRGRRTSSHISVDRQGPHRRRPREKNLSTVVSYTTGHAHRDIRFPRYKVCNLQKERCLQREVTLPRVQSAKCPVRPELLGQRSYHRCREGATALSGQRCSCPSAAVERMFQVQNLRTKEVPGPIA